MSGTTTRGAAAEAHDDVPMPEQLARAHELGLTRTEYKHVLRSLNRVPNPVELGLISAMWSEHCSYKSSRHWLARLPSSAEHVIQGPGENAGVIDIGDGFAAIFKMESHNHPSFIEPYQGAATGVGGIMRDVFTMGARPMANLNALRFGAPAHSKTRHLLAGVVAGIGGYGNCIGVPTVGGETNFDSSYNGNILVNAMCVGVARTNKIFYARASTLGAPVVYVGAKTGRDGIHGATMASAEFASHTTAQRPTVQVGDPFTEKLLLEACLELMQSDAIIAIQDMGAAGLTSSSVEMAGKGGVGIHLMLDKIPCRVAKMTPYEIMLSESQERMLMVLKPAAQAQAQEIFTRWGLDFSVIGTLTENRHIRLTDARMVVADLPIRLLSDDAPLYKRPHVTPKTYAPVHAPRRPAESSATYLDVLVKLLGGFDLASRRWLWQQYDFSVMGDTLAGPGGDAALVRVHGTDKALALTCDSTPRYCAAAPHIGGMQAVVEAWRNITAVGAQPLAITNCLNFGNPERPEIMGQFVACIEGMREACLGLDFPVVSGNVSFYNETDGCAILPTPTIGGVGLLNDYRHAIGLGSYNDGDVLILIGACDDVLGGSLYLRDILGVTAPSAPPAIDLVAERLYGDFVRAHILAGTLGAAHDVSDGGLLVAIAEMVLAAGCGVCLDDVSDADMNVGFWFGEAQARYVVALASDACAAFMAAAAASGVPVRTLGIFGGTQLTIGSDATISIEALRAAHESCLPDYMAS